MHKVAAYLFLFVYLFANTELHELVKLDAFVAHYAEHRQENKDITLIDFIVIHYFSGNIVDDDYSKDMQLPFKNVDCNNFIPSITFALPEFLDLKTCATVKSDMLPIYDQSMLPSSHLSDIWQPPKSC
jgi:hypothetical protein